MEFYDELYAKGGYAMVAIAFLSVLMVALIVWKLITLIRLGVWHSNGALMRRVDAATRDAAAKFSRDDAESEAQIVGQAAVSEVRQGLRILEVIAAIAPLLGLMGTVLGMISAFQALQASGAQADPKVLAGGIWEALLTTAAGMSVAIPASITLAWFDGIAERVTRDIEGRATRILITHAPRSARDDTPVQGANHPQEGG